MGSSEVLQGDSSLAGDVSDLARSSGLCDTPTDEPDQLILAQPKKIYPKSLSGLKLYSTCSLSWKFQKFDGIKNQPAAWLPQGTAFGGVAEVWEKSFRYMTEVEQKEFYYNLFDSEILKYKEVQPDLTKWLTMGRTRIQTDIDNRRERGWDQWLVYRDRAMREAGTWKVWELPDGTPAVEVSFNVDLGDDLIVRGYVDIVKEWIGSGELTVNDLKTGNREKSSRQLGVYRLALNEVFGAGITSGSFYYAKDDTYSRSFDLSVWTEDYLREQFTAMQKGIENRVFIANVGDFCGLCPAKAQCPDYNSVL